jgi:hypothetical protein
MDRKLKLALALLILAPLAPLAAHHSYSMFDMNRTVALNGTVAQFKWQNPHAFILIDVPVAGKAERWAIEMTSPNNLIQSGWKRTTLKAGDKVRLFVHPLRSGAPGASYAGVVLADGTTLGQVE